MGKAEGDRVLNLEIEEEAERVQQLEEMLRDECVFWGEILKRI